MSRARQLFTCAVAAAVAFGMAPAAAQTDDTYDVLVVGKTLGFRHSNIDEATRAIIALGGQNGFTVDVWDPPNNVGGWWGPGSPGQPDLTLASTPFTTADLAKYETIVFVSPVDNTNDLNPNRERLLNDSELAAFQGYIRDGGGFVGLHAATDTMHTVPWYSQLTGGGARFRNHPAQQTATMLVESPEHPSTEHLPLEWTRFDEWYNFTTNPRADVHVLVTLDESTYNPGSGAMGDDHPLAWCHNFEGGRSWYEGAGHTEASFADPVFLQHVLGGIEWTAGVANGGGNCVTFGEVDRIIEGLEIDSTRTEVAVRLISSRLDRAEAAAEAGDREQALKELRVAGTLAGAMVSDRYTAQVLKAKVGDLAEWQQGLLDNGM
ncbi:MAG TPA: ThuA domain-containing protein [Jiangellales bacterium]|nr:ThuA domain-containing protein [Jiangellales bacterium]